MSERWPLANEEFFDVMGTGDVSRFNLSLTNMGDVVLRGLLKIFHADSTGFFACSLDGSRSPDKSKTVTLNLSSSHVKQYHEYYHQTDPFLKIIPGVGSYRDTDLMLPADFQRTEWYHDFLKPQNQHHQLELYLHHGRQLLGYIGILRNDINNEFSKKDLVKARYLARILSLKLKKSQMNESFTSLEQLLKQVCDLSSEGIIILSSGFCPIYWNNKAEEMGLSVDRKLSKPGYNDRFWPLLPFEIVNECMRMGKCVQLADENLDDACRGSVLYVGRNPELKVQIKVLPPLHRSQEGSNPFYFLLILSETHGTHFGNDLIMPGNWKLTSRELEIVHLVRQGLTNKEVSGKLGVSVPTVATHLRHIFEKMGIGSRAKLIREMEPG